jgi:hypothetical protein
VSKKVEIVASDQIGDDRHSESEIRAGHSDRPAHSQMPLLWMKHAMRALTTVPCSWCWRVHDRAADLCEMRQKRFVAPRALVGPLDGIGELLAKRSKLGICFCLH